MGLTGALGLGNLHNRLPARTILCVRFIDWFSISLILGRKHHTAGQVAVMRDCQHLAPGVFLIGRQIVPEVLYVFRVEEGERQHRFDTSFIAPKHHHSVQIVTAGLRGPLVTNKGGEFAGVVVMVGELHDFGPRIAQHGFAFDFCFCAFGHFLDQRIKGIDTFTRHDKIIELLAKRI